MKSLRKYNGVIGGRLHAVVAAYSAADAVRLLNEMGCNASASWFRDYWSFGLWGKSAEEQIGLNPPCRGLWISKKYGGEFQKIVEHIREAKQ